MTGQNESTLKPEGVSRRKFIEKSLAAAAGAIALGVSGSALLGCQADKDAELVNDGTNAYVPDETINIYNAELLIVGCGVSGAQVAIKAIEKGASVVVVDKGPFQFSGAGGYNWDILLGYSKQQLPVELGVSNSYALRNPAVFAQMETYESEIKPNSLLYYVQQGGTTFHRTPDGQILWYLDMPEYSLTDKGFTRYATDMLRDMGLTIIDQTIVTDIIVMNGICRGVIGIHIPTGTISVIRANAVIKTTGGSTQTYGWTSVSPITLNSPDNTGDLDVAALRHGCELIDNEFYKWDLITLFPDGIAGAFNSGIGADTTDYAHVSDATGECFLKDIPQSEMDRNRFTQEVSRRIYEGKGSPAGGVFVDMSAEAAAKLRPVYGRNVELWKKIFDIDVTGEKLELGLECFEHSGVPRVDENLMTSIKGFFDVRGGGTAGEEAAISGFRSYRQGPYVAERAVEYLAHLDGTEDSFDWLAVQSEIDRIVEIRERRVEDGLRPHQVRHNIQKACFNGLGPIRDADGLNSAIAELERILKEDMPKQYIQNKTRIFNIEWRDAVENYNLIYLALAAAKASLMREESRGEMARGDFPEPSDYWAQYNIAATLVSGDLVIAPTEVGQPPKTI